jgi:hypothetical protein
MLPRQTNSTPITFFSSCILTALLLACAPDGTAADPDDVCTAPRLAARLPDVLAEASGVAISRQFDGVLWVINDTEPVARVFAIDTAGIVLNEVRVRDARNLDWEDVAVGACAAGHCLYIAEIGDNLHDRETVGFYRVPEPDPGDSVTAPAEWFPFRYPTGPQDAEALFVAPDETVYVISKGRNRPVTLYRYPPPLREDQTLELELLQELSEGIVQLPDMVTGAGITPDGIVVAVRTYAWLRLYRLDGNALEPLLEAPGIDLAPLAEPQGEGTDIRRDGWIVLTGERGLDAQPAPLGTLHCRLDSLAPRPNS